MKTANTTKAAKTYCLPDRTTPEMLESRMMYDMGTVLNYGGHVLVSGYFYNPNGKSFYAAIYTFIGEGRSCEDIIDLTTIAPETFEDNGHAIAWAIAHAK